MKDQDEPSGIRRLAKKKKKHLEEAYRGMMPSFHPSAKTQDINSQTQK